MSTENDGRRTHRLLRARDWQPRPELDAVLEWWRGGGRGVCSLVGMGGAGKTAIADRFLQMLPGPYPNLRDVAKDPTLARPERALVFSFYDVPNADGFFRAVLRWLRGVLGQPEPNQPSRGSLRQTMELIELLPPDQRFLLVLDGLEKVQDDGLSKGRFGQIVDGRLRTLVVDAADGYLPTVSLLITTRLWVYALALRDYHRRVDVDKLEVERCVDLLRSRGVIGGTRAALRVLAKDHGRHALSVDLLGGYIHRFCAGDPSLLPPSAMARSAAAMDARLDPSLYEIQQQERRLAELTKRYQDALVEHDAAALALLQRICLFRLGITLENVAAIFTGDGKETVSGPDLARLDAAGLRRRLAVLTEMKLIERSEGTTADALVTYTIHPAVRDGFLAKLDAEVARQGHAAARAGLEASLGTRPGGLGRPSDPRTLDLLEEVVHHAIAAGQLEDAWSIYSARIGGVRNLLWRLGDAERGDRILRGFSAAVDEPPVGTQGDVRQSRSRFLSHAAAYRDQLGRGEASLHLLKLHARMKGRIELTDSLPDIPTLLLVAGRVAEAARALAGTSGRFRAVSRAGIDAIAGRSKVAVEVFESSDLGATKYSAWHARLLLRIGNRPAALRVARESKKVLRGIYGNDDNDIPSCNLLLGEIALGDGDLPKARAFLAEVRDWAVPRDAKLLLTGASLLEAKIDLADPGRTESKAVATGLRTATEHGYGLLHIQLRTAEARFALRRGDAAAAMRALDIALFEGVHPPINSGNPALLAATDPECGFAWGIAEGRHLLGETYLLQAADRLGAPRLPASSPPKDVAERVALARSTLTEALELRDRILDPLADATRALLAQLDIGVLTRRPLRRSADPTRIPARRRFKVALSFPGEHRGVVDRIAQALARALGRDLVFYDRYYEHELARLGLDTYLQRIYVDESDLVVVFLCAEYQRKEWCRLEWRAIRDLIKRRREDEIMPIRLDGSDVDGFFSNDGYLDAADRDAEEIAAFILRRVGIP